MDDESSMNQTDSLEQLRDQISALPAAKRALLELGLKEKLRPAVGVQAIPRLVNRDSVPASFAQQRLWFLDQLEPGNPVYNIPSAVSLKGPLNVAAVEQSLNEIIRRQGALRTTFATIDGQPFQVISRAQSLSLSVIDLQDLPETEREDRARRLITDEARRPFDLARGPLFRAKLFRLGPEQHVLFLMMHHIISDGWSIGVFVRELATLYESFCVGKPSPLSELPVQYADFASWQRGWLQGEVLEAQLSYWKKQLTGVSPLLELSICRSRPPVQAYRGKRQSCVLPVPLSQQLKARSREEGVTLFMLLLAAFQVLLRHYSGRDDIVVGTDVANRNRVEIEGLVGFFVNQIVLRADLSGNPSFRELLGRVREAAFRAYAYQELPFEKLVEALNPERNLKYSPLFQVKMVLQNAPRPALELAGLTLSPLDVDNETAKFDLMLILSERPEGLNCKYVYNTDLFDVATISRMAEHFETLVRHIVVRPEARLDALAKILTDVDMQHQIIKESDLKQARSQKFKSIKRKAAGESRSKVEDE